MKPERNENSRKVKIFKMNFCSISLETMLKFAVLHHLIISCASMPRIEKSCRSLLSGENNKDVNSPDTAIYSYKGSRVGIHNIFSSFEVSIRSAEDFTVLEHSTSEGLSRHLKMKESSFLGRMFKRIGGLFVLGSLLPKNESQLERSPFSTLYIGLLFESPVFDEEPSAEISCHVTLFDRKLMAFFLFGLALFFFAETCSRHVLFFYASGLTLGLLMSWMIVLILILKLIPYKKSLFVGLATSGTSIGLYLTQSLLMNLQFYAQYHAYWLLWYMGIVSLLTCAALYYKGPPKSDKTLNLIKWSLQLLGLLCIFNSTWAFEVAVTIVVLTITSYLSVQYLDVASFTKSKIKCSLLKLLRVETQLPVRRLLTEDEYRDEARVETEKALRELRGYCSSPECDSWRVVSKVKDPKRFANFVRNSDIFKEEEIEEYENFEVAEDEDSWLSSDQEQLPESTKDDILEESFQLELSDDSLDLM